MNNCIYLTKEEYKAYLYNTKSLDSGNYGEIFIYKNGKVLKLWKDSISQKDLLLFGENIQKLAKHQYHSLLFPEKLVFCEGVLVGYTMSYFPGKNIKDINLNVKMELLLKAIHRLEIALKRASASHILLDDCHNENIMYYEKMNIGLCVCTDCDTWIENHKIREEQCFKHNVTEVNETFVNTILRDNVPAVIDFIVCHGDLKNRLENIDYNISIELYSFFVDVVEKIEKYTNEHIITLGDMQRVLK